MIEHYKTETFRETLTWWRCMRGLPGCAHRERGRAKNGAPEEPERSGWDDWVQKTQAFGARIPPLGRKMD